MDIILPPKKNIVMDATLFSSLQGCARYVDLRYNHNFLPLKGKSNSLECGSLVHKILEVFYGYKIQGMSRQMAIGHAMTAGHLYITGCPHCSVPENLEPACRHQPLEYPGMRNTPEENESNKRIGWKWVLATMEQYFDFYKDDFWTPLFVETVRGDILYEDDEIRVIWKAKIDWCVDTNNGVFPIDHKTMKQRRDESNLNNQFIGQCLVMKTRSMIINRIGFQTTLEPKEKFTREMITYSADRLLEWQSEILPYYAYKYMQYTESGYWPPDWTHCESKYGFCMFKDVCIKDRGMREEELKLNFFVGPPWDVLNMKEDE